MVMGVLSVMKLTTEDLEVFGIGEHRHDCCGGGAVGRRKVVNTCWIAFFTLMMSAVGNSKVQRLLVQA
jgi:hypothetical protein